MAHLLAAQTRSRTLSAAPGISMGMRLRAGTDTIAGTPSHASLPAQHQQRQPLSSPGTALASPPFNPSSQTHSRPASALSFAQSFRQQLPSFASSPFARWAQTQLASFAAPTMPFGEPSSHARSVSDGPTPTISSDGHQLHRTHLQRVLVKILRVHYNLYDRATVIRDALRSHHPIDDVLLSAFSDLYNDTAKSTRLLRVHLADPIWGLAPTDGLVTEEECREHLVSELNDILVALEDEIRRIVPVALRTSAIGRAVLTSTQTNVNHVSVQAT